MSRAKASADRLIAKHGFAVTISATDADTAAVVDRSGYAVITGVLPHLLAGSVALQVDDEILLVTAEALPEIGARLTYLDRDRVVAATTPTMEGAVAAAHTVVARVG